LFLGISEALFIILRTTPKQPQGNTNP